VVALVGELGEETRCPLGEVIRHRSTGLDSGNGCFQDVETTLNNVMLSHEPIN